MNVDGAGAVEAKAPAVGRCLQRKSDLRQRQPLTPCPSHATLSSLLSARENEIYDLAERRTTKTLIRSRSHFPYFVSVLKRWSSQFVDYTNVSGDSLQLSNARILFGQATTEDPRNMDDKVWLKDF